MHAAIAFENMIMMFTAVRYERKAPRLKLKSCNLEKISIVFAFIVRTFVLRYAEKSKTCKCKSTLWPLLLLLHSPHGVGLQCEQFSDYQTNSLFFSKSDHTSFVFILCGSGWCGQTSEVNRNDSIRFNLKL